MKASLRLATAIAVCLALVLLATGCGGGGGASKGGTLTMLTDGDVDDNLDPGYSYYQLDYIYTNAVHRAVLGYKPDDVSKASPDLAESYPTISDEGKTITVKLKKGVKFSPPVDREATSADVKYGMERAFLPKLGNGYVNSYWADVEGVKEYVDGKADEISGLQTPDEYTLVMKLTRPSAAIAVQALALPAAAPVPKEYAQKFDEEKKSTYGEHVVFTGPYMVENDPKTGEITGYKPGRSIKFVRNPNWDKSTDFRPAYLDSFVFDEGNDATIGNEKVIDGESMVGNPVDLAPPPPFLKANQDNKDNLISGAFSGRVRYVALNTTKKPFDDVNVRKAVSAVLDREGMALAFGGEFAGSVATHIIPPEINGFEEAGGVEGFGFDWLATPAGDMALAADYLKKAGFEDGKYSGPEITMAADNSSVQQDAAERVLDGFEQLGFEVNFRPVNRDTMYSKFCSVPKSQPEACPSVAWQKDFADPQTMLGPTFKGSNIVATGNVNWPQLDDPKINDAMDKAELLVDPADRARAWAEIDKMVTGTAAVIPWQWDKPPLVKSSNVKAVLNKANAAWDMSYTAIEK
jgi:peptide/nickel transport system substrate-binding protein